MLDAVCLGTNDLAKAGKFYDQVFACLGIIRRFENEVEIGYGKPQGPINFWVLTPYNKQQATHGNGSQVMFKATSAEQVQKFYQAGLQAGGSDEGAPGPRDYREGYYGAYLRDLDFNKLHIW